MLFKRRASPFPNPAHFALTSDLVAVCGHGHGMPMLETNIGTLEIDEELLRAPVGVQRM